MQICGFINSQKQSEFWDTSPTQEFNESPLFLKSLKTALTPACPPLPAGLQSECVYTGLKPPHKRIISAVTTSSNQVGKDELCFLKSEVYTRVSCF